MSQCPGWVFADDMERWEGCFPTQVGDELLGDVHPAQQLLQEAEGKSFLNGGCIQFHVLKTPASAETVSSDTAGLALFHTPFWSACVHCPLAGP